jgi:hypothetical protein
LDLLGEPSSRATSPDGADRIEYHSIRKRESVERVFGVEKNRHAQSMEETVVLIFKDQILVDKQKSNRVY